MRRLTIRYAEKKRSLKAEVRGRKRRHMRGKKTTKVQVRKYTTGKKNMKTRRKEQENE